MKDRSLVFTILFFLALLLFACSDNANETSSSSNTTPAVGQTTPVPSENSEETASVPTLPPTITPIPPTPTPSEPLAALVNDQPIYLSTYEKELARYEQAQTELGLESPEDENGEINHREVVLNALIEQALIAQAAEAQGITVTPAMVTQKMAELREAAGGADNFAAWLEANQWTEDEFGEALAAEMLTEQVVATVTADVPQAVEQVRARYIQVDDPTLAQSLLEQIRSGSDFALLAGQNSLDQVTAQNGGDLGYFARGSLLVPEVETAAFALQPGEVSEVIPVAGGDQTTYYLVQLVERDPNRPLTADLRYNLLQQAFESWLAGQWSEARIERFVSTGA